MDDQRTVTASPGDLFWRYWKPQNGDSKMLLLTKGGIAVAGSWSGELGEYFYAWCPMPRRDKALEKRLFEQRK